MGIREGFNDTLSLPPENNVGVINWPCGCRGKEGTGVKGEENKDIASQGQTVLWGIVIQ